MLKGGLEEMIDVTAEDLVTEIMMTIGDSTLAVLVVEGETDKALYGALFAEHGGSAVLIFPAGSRDFVLSVISIMNNGLRAGVFLPCAGLVDQDYSVPLGAPLPPANVFGTDLRDIECMMIQSQALKSVCDEYVDWVKARAAGLKDVSDIRAVMEMVCLPLGYLRYWSQAIGAHYVFKSLDVADCLDKSGTSLDQATVLNKLRGAQKPGNVLPQDAFVQAVESCNNVAHFNGAPLLACRGHDLVAVLAAQVRKKWGRGHARDLRVDALERNLRLAYPRYWQNTKQIQDVRAWFHGVGLGGLLT